MTWMHKALIIAVVSVLACTACHTSKTTATEDTTVDTEQLFARTNTAHQLEHNTQSTDTVYVSDSTIVVIDNGNVYKSRYRDTYRSRNKTDTLRLSDTTTVYVYKNKIKKRTTTITKQAQLTTWQKFKLNTYTYLAALTAILAAVVIYQNRKTFNKYLRK